MDDEELDELEELEEDEEPEELEEEEELEAVDELELPPVAREEAAPRLELETLELEFEAELLPEADPTEDTLEVAEVSWPIALPPPAVLSLSDYGLEAGQGNRSG